MNVVKKIEEVMKGLKPNHDVIKIVDYREKDAYVVYIRPKGAPKEGIYRDSMIMLNNETLKLIHVFNPMIDDGKTYFSVINDRVIYEL